MREFLKSILRPVKNLFANFGFDPRKLVSLRYYPKYRKDYKEFQRLGGKVTHRYAMLSEFNDQAGSAKGHYFHQDLLVASFIHQKNPNRHVDVGSSVGGFVAHVAAFREIEVIDIRALEYTGHKNIIFRRANMMDDKNVLKELTDSLSCLHAIEHFGLGRYGDPIDPFGHIKGFNNLLKMLKIDGTLYISFPIGRQNEVHFNAHRVFYPMDVLGWANDADSIQLERFDFVDDVGNLHQNVEVEKGVDLTYGCGIYTFTKIR